MDARTFLTVATAAEQRLGDQRVAARWEDPSALVGYTIGGLAGHLGRSILTVARYLDAPAPDPGATPLDAAAYFVEVLGTDDPVDSDLHRGVRQRSEEAAKDGHAALVAQVHEARDALEARLADVDAEQLIAALHGTVLTVQGYLDTRLCELVIHLDDLAVSLGDDGAADLPIEAFETVAAVLARVAVHRAGALETIRSLARRERHPDAVRAF